MSVRTLNELYAHAVTNHPQSAMFRHKLDGKWQDVSTTEVAQAVLELSQGLVSLGVEPASRVALLSENRLEWALADLASLTAGAIVVPVYPSLMAHQIEYILRNCEPTAIFCSTAEQADKIVAIAENVPSLRSIITFDRVDKADVLPLAKVRELGQVQHRNHPEDAERRRSAVEEGDVATIIYTSGTTGNPKGVMLSHRNIVQNVLAGLSVLDVRPEDTCLSFLPLSHIFERMAGYYVMMHQGATIAYAQTVETVAEDMTVVKPTVMVSVPRLYEKIYARVLHAASQGSSTKRRLFDWARSIGTEVTACRVRGQSPSLWLNVRAVVADALVFKKLRARTGGRLRYFVSGGAPLAKEIAEFFFAARLPILEGYGLTETSPVITVNTLEHFRPGSVGPVVPGVEVKIADDGEIHMRGPSLMTGYYKDDAATHAAIVDGWFHTGDIGYIDADGYLHITDRKKDLLVTAGGKNIAPQPIENELKLNKYVTEAVLVGDRRKYLTALLVPSFEALEDFARTSGIGWTDHRGLLEAPEVNALFERAVSDVNELHPSFEQIKYFRLLDHEFTLESGQLTPSLKVKRKVVLDMYTDAIETMYTGDE